MAVFYFDVHDNAGVLIDDEGLVLPVDAAMSEAWRSLMSITREWGDAPVTPAKLAIEVRDEIGVVARAQMAFSCEIMRKN